MKNERGFALISFLAFLPLLIALVASLYVVMGLLEDQTAARNSCRRQLLSGLEQAGRPMKQVMDLNPLAWELRRQLGLATAALAAASTSGNPAAIASATARLQAVRRQQQLLDLRQKALLKTASVQLFLSQNQAFAAVTKNPFGFLKNTPQIFSPIRPALRPDMATLAPAYVLEEPFAQKQALVQKWQSVFQLRGPLQNFLEARGRIKQTCAATLVPEGAVWKARLIEDKF